MAGGVTNFTNARNPMACVLHDKTGGLIDVSNPLPVNLAAAVTLDASITLGTIGLVGATGNRLVVNADGSINTTGGAAASTVGITGAGPNNYRLVINSDGSLNADLVGSLPTGTNAIGGVTQAGVWSVGINAMPALVAGTAIVGKVGIDQTTDGTTNGVHVTNASLPVTGTVAVSNFPASQAVTGTVAVSNFPATQSVSLAATVVVQDTAAEASLASLVANSPVLGQALKLASVPVARASDDDTIYDRINRRTAEIAAWAAQDQVFAVLASRANERASMFDRRGRYDRGSVR